MRRRNDVFLLEDDLTAKRTPLSPPRRSRALPMSPVKYRSSHVANKCSPRSCSQPEAPSSSGLTPTLAHAHPLHSEALLTKDHISIVTAQRVTPDSVGIYLFPAPIWEGFLCHLLNIQNTSLYISKLNSSSIHNTPQEECGRRRRAGKSPLFRLEAMASRPSAGRDPNQVSPHRLSPPRSGKVPKVKSGMKGLSMFLNRREEAVS